MKDHGMAYVCFKRKEITLFYINLPNFCVSLLEIKELAIMLVKSPS